MPGSSQLLACSRRLALAAAASSSKQKIHRCASSASTGSQYNVQTPAPPSHRNSKSIPPGQKRQSRPRPDRINNDAKELTTSFRLALSGLDLEDSWRVWTQIRAKGKQRHTSGVDHDNLRSLIEQTPESEEKLKELSSNYLKDGSWLSLIECLKIELKLGQYAHVLDIVSEVFTQLKREQGTSSSITIPRALVSQMVVYAAFACSNLPKPSVRPLIRLVRPLTPYKINLAGAREKTSTDSVSNGSPLSLSRAVKVLQGLFIDPESARVPLAYCRHAILAWGLDYPKSPIQREEGNFLARRIGLLFAANDLGTIPMIIATAFEAREEKYGRWLSMSVHHDIKADWNDMTWSALLSSSIASRRPELAEKAWTAYNDIKESDHVPTIRIWNALLDGYARIGEWESVYKTWEQMQSMGRQPDNHVYTTMISAFFRANMPSEAMLIFEEGKERTAKGEMEWSPEAISSVLHGLLYNNRKTEASQLFADMRNGKAGMPKPTVNAVNVFLQAYGRQGDFAKIVETLQSASELCLEPDVYTFTTVLDAFSRAGVEGAIDKVYALMQKIGVRESSATLTTMINHVLQRDESMVGKPDYQVALQLLSKMEEQGPYPTAVTYTCIISSLCHHAEVFNESYKSGKLPKHYLNLMQNSNKRNQADTTVPSQLPLNLRLALILLEQMRKRSLVVNRVTYHTLISGLLGDSFDGQEEEGRPVDMARLKKAMQLVEEVCVDPGANSYTWTLVLQRLMVHCSSQDLTLAAEASKQLSKVLERIRSSEQQAHLGTMRELMQKAAMFSFDSI